MSYNERPVLTLTLGASGTISAHRFVTPAGAQAGAWRHLSKSVRMGAGQARAAG